MNSEFYLCLYSQQDIASLARAEDYGLPLHKTPTS